MPDLCTLVKYLTLDCWTPSHFSSRLPIACSFLKFHKRSGLFLKVTHRWWEEIAKFAAPSRFSVPSMVYCCFCTARMEIWDTLSRVPDVTSIFRNWQHTRSQITSKINTWKKKNPHKNISWVIGVVRDNTTIARILSVKLIQLTYGDVQLSRWQSDRKCTRTAPLLRRTGSNLKFKFFPANLYAAYKFAPVRGKNIYIQSTLS